MSWLAIGGLGALGVLCRYGIEVSMRGFLGAGTFPWSTLGINVVGSLLAGFLFAFGALRPSQEGEFFRWAIVGFCGGFTTYSAFSIQTLEMIQQNRWFEAGLYWTLTPALCLAGAYAGFQLVR